MRVDRNNSRNALAQSDDYVFFVGEDGVVSSEAGNGAGEFIPTGSDGLQAQVSANPTTWSAELRIDKTTLNGWNHLVGTSIGHYGISGANDVYTWPYITMSNNPSTWATTALGIQPTISALEPYTAIVNDSPFTLTVHRTNLISGTTVLWNGNALPTTFVDDGQLTAQVSADQLNSAGSVTITTRSPDLFVSNDLSFLVRALAPMLTSITPTSLEAGSAGTTLTVNGANFATDAEVLWNGTPLVTQFVGTSQLTAQVDAALLAQGQTVGIVVRNTTPETQISNTAMFEVQPRALQRTYLPLIQR